MSLTAGFIGCCLQQCVRPQNRQISNSLRKSIRSSLLRLLQRDRAASAVLKSTCEILNTLRFDALDNSNPLRVLNLANYKRIEPLKSPQRNQRLQISSLSCGLTDKS